MILRSFRIFIFLVSLLAPPLLWSAETTHSNQTTQASDQYVCPDFAAQNPDLTGDLRREGETEFKMSLRENLKACGDGILSAWNDTIEELLIDPYVYMTQTSPAQTRAFLENCNKSEICKNQLFYEAYGRRPSSAENTKISSSMSFSDLDILYRNAKSRMNSTGEQNRRLRYELLNRKWLKDDVASKETTGPEQETASFWQLLKGIVKNEREKFSCLKPEAALQLFCYYAAQIIDPTIVAGVVTKAPKIAKLAKAGFEKVKNIKKTEAAMIEAKALVYGKTQFVFNKEELAQLNLKAKAIADSNLPDDEKIAKISALYFDARIKKLPKKLQEEALTALRNVTIKGDESFAKGTEMTIKSDLAPMSYYETLSHEFEHVIQELDKPKKAAITRFFKYAFGNDRVIEEEIEAIGAEWDLMQLVPKATRENELARSIVKEGIGSKVQTLPDGTYRRVSGSMEQRRIDASLKLSREDYIREMRRDSGFVGMTSAEDLKQYRKNLLLRTLGFFSGI